METPVLICPAEWSRHLIMKDPGMHSADIKAVRRSTKLLGDEGLTQYVK